MIKRIIPLVAIILLFTGCAQASNKTHRKKTVKTQQMKVEPQTEPEKEVGPTTDKLVEIETSEGRIVVKLFGDTPRHQANFLKLVKDGTYNGTLFHRVIDNFMIQAGDPESKNAPAGKMLGSGDVGYRIDAEIVYPKHFHHRGALAAARQGDQVNPERKSSGCQFYIVTGSPVNDAMLSQMAASGLDSQKQTEFMKLVEQNRDRIMEMQKSGDQAGLMKLQNELIQQTEDKFKDVKAPELPEDLKTKYKEVGGAPHLDNQYTVFGEVVEGMDVVEKIEKAQTDSHDRPLNDIRIISMKVLD